MNEIKSKITNVVVVKDDGEMNEDTTKLRKNKSNKKRPIELNGTTYSIKTGLLENKLYVTINNIEIDDEPGKYKPFEMFINSRDKSMMIDLEILSATLSAIFRRTSTPDFIIKELKISSSVQNGYFRPPREGETKGKYIPSIYFEIAEILEIHMKKLGIVDYDSDDDVIDNVVSGSVMNTIHVEDEGFGLTKCPNCGKHGIKKESGCEACIYCEYSKCG